MISLSQIQIFKRNQSNEDLTESKISTSGGKKNNLFQINKASKFIDYVDQVSMERVINRFKDLR